MYLPSLGFVYRKIPPQQDANNSYELPANGGNECNDFQSGQNAEKKHLN